jgi:hypothetical protein
VGQADHGFRCARCWRRVLAEVSKWYIKMIHYFKSSCVPQNPTAGDMKWILTIPLQNGDDYLELELGKRGRDAIKCMLEQEEKDDEIEAKA